MLSVCMLQICLRSQVAWPGFGYTFTCTLCYSYYLMILSQSRSPRARRRKWHWAPTSWYEIPGSIRYKGTRPITST